MRAKSSTGARGGKRGLRLMGAALCSLAVPAFAQDKPTVEELQRRLEALERRLGGDAAVGEDGQGEASLADLDQRLRILERRLELQEEDRVAKAKEASVVAVNDKGAALKSADGAYEVRIRGLLQGDGRFFDSGVPASANDTFLLRTARPTIEGTLGKWVGFRFTPEFAGDSASIVDAYADLKFSPAATVRLGKFTSPVGLERLQSSSALSDVERALPSEIAPNRDIGVQLQGELAQGRVGYAIGVFNGTVDGRDAVTSNPDDNFEYAGRVFFEPFKNGPGFWSGLGFGLGAGVGDVEGSGNNFLPRYRTPGQQQFFAYRGAVAADGRHVRWSPQGYFYRNRFGLLAEYIVAKQELLVGETRAELENRSWQATASYVLTGEDANYRGVVRPSHPFAPGKGGWGAWELVGRYGVLEVDEDSFPLFADPTASAGEARAWVLGLNWYLNSNLKLVLNYLDTSFEGGNANGADREDEKAVFARLQVAF
ncbi:porin [Pseudoxanthomonas sangjuensis]|uniref:OprO/OprP family phosphate-selective porin n=1 Tax=Pseudoxanthomonas sangjuensis TaxID=1503750 RepID=UPI001390D9F6|nr:porin [Pseudoxanthomonas sangjuensis]KAF1714757.1 porin [Pseudoxanthomonas sangjuensis]